jgi:trk system potassium uptake protein TrkA
MSPPLFGKAQPFPPNQIRIGAVLRNDEVIIPRSNFVFKKQDIVVLLAKKDFLHIVENMFRISSI